MQRYYDHSQEFYFPSTEQIEEFQTIKMSLSNHKSQDSNTNDLFDPLNQRIEAIQQFQNKEMQEKFRKFNQLLNTIRQTNEELQFTVTASTTKEQTQEMVLTKLKVNLKNFALTEVQLKYLIFLQQKYRQSQKIKHPSKDQDLQTKRKNLVEVKKPNKNLHSHIHHNPRKFKVKW